MKAAAARPVVVAFDVNETLFDLTSLGDVFAKFGLPPHSLPWWFATVLRDGMALSASGGPASFGELAGAALDEVAVTCGKHLAENAPEVLLDAFGMLPAHPDVRPALELLASSGVPAVALTNGSAGTTEALLERAAVRNLVSDVISAGEVGHWKPRSEPYRHACDRAGARPGLSALVAVHPWDVHGAIRAGLVGGWANRGGRPFPPVFTEPHVQGGTLVAVVEALLALPRT